MLQYYSANVLGLYFKNISGSVGTVEAHAETLLYGTACVTNSKAGRSKLVAIFKFFEFSNLIMCIEAKCLPLYQVYEQYPLSRDYSDQNVG